MKVQIILYLLPLVSRKMRDIYKNPREEIPKVVKGYFWAVVWMTMGTWMSIVQLCHIHRYAGTFEKHWLMPMLSNFLGLLWVAVDYASRVKQLAVFMAPKAIEVFGNMMQTRNLISKKVLRKLIILIQALAFGLVAAAFGDKKHPRSGLAYTLGNFLWF